jgi:signal transduction histidine kinase
VDVTPSRSSVVLRARSEPRRLVLEVQDEGPGIPASLRERIFQPFFSTREERPGGLGLAISRRIVEEAGGHLSVEPGPEGGSLFRVVLPTE